MDFIRAFGIPLAERFFLFGVLIGFEISQQSRGAPGVMVTRQKGCIITTMVQCDSFTHSNHSCLFLSSLLLDHRYASPIVLPS